MCQLPLISLDGGECYYPTFYVEYIDENNMDNCYDINAYELKNGFNEATS